MPTPFLQGDETVASLVRELVELQADVNALGDQPASEPRMASLLARMDEIRGKVGYALHQQEEAGEHLEERVAALEERTDEEWRPAITEELSPEIVESLSVADDFKQDQPWAREDFLLQTPLLLYITTANESGGQITAKRCNSDGRIDESYPELTFEVLPEEGSRATPSASPSGTPS